MGAKKKIATDGFGSATNNKLPVYKKKVTPYKEPQFLRDLRLNRERHFWRIATTPEAKREHQEYAEFMKSEWAKQDKRDEKN